MKDFDIQFTPLSFQSLTPDFLGVRSRQTQVRANVLEQTRRSPRSPSEVRESYLLRVMVRPAIVEPMPRSRARQLRGRAPSSSADTELRSAKYPERGHVQPDYCSLTKNRFLACDRQVRAKSQVNWE
jgi:hypothetical protein